MNVKKYLKECGIKTTNQLSSHIKELEVEARPNLKLINVLKETLANELEDYLYSGFVPKTINAKELKTAIHINEELNLKELKETAFNDESLGLDFKDVLGISLCDNKEYVHKLIERKKAERDLKQQEEKEPPVSAYKETKGKLFYELDWEFITQMAERMASNKKEGKYSLWNWQKPMAPEGIEDLKQASLRHLLEVLEGRYEDDGRPFGHIEAISDNMMMINYQLRNNKK